MSEGGRRFRILPYKHDKPWRCSESLWDITMEAQHVFFSIWHTSNVDVEASVGMLLFH